MKITTQSNSDLLLVSSLEKSLAKEPQLDTPKLNQKPLSSRKTTLASPLDFQQPFSKLPTAPIVEVKSSTINHQANKVMQREIQAPLIDPKVIAQAKAATLNNERELEHQMKPEGEITRQFFESPNYSIYCNFINTFIVNTPIEDLKIPLIRAISGTEAVLRQAETPRMEGPDSAFSIFNPAEDLGHIRSWYNLNIPFGRSPTSQFNRFISQAEDENLLGERAGYTPLSGLMGGRHYFTLGGANNEHETKPNY